MAYPKVLHFDTIREVAFGGIGAAYAAVGAALAHPARIVCYNNGCDQDVYFSIDGVNNQLRVPARSFKVFDVSANKIRDDGFFYPVGTVFYIVHAGVAPTTASAWIEVIYADN